jgi:OTU domain-containing protein 6
MNANDDNDDDESYEQVLKRHETEMEKFELEMKRLNHNENRGRKLRQQIEERHYSELLPYKLDSLLLLEEEEELQKQQKQQKTNVSSTLSTEQQRKKNKNKKRQEAKKKKEQNMRQQVADELKRDGGLTDRQRELIAITQQLTPMKLRIHEVESDGHCLYRAVCHQVKQVDQQSNLDYLKLRKQVASYMRQHIDDFLPFMETENGDLMDDVQYENYCKKIESSSEWGGQLELKAITHILQKPIKIYQSTQPIVMGEEFLQEQQENEQALTVSFHRSYYSLGEHYNSIIPATEDDDE